MDEQKDSNNAYDPGEILPKNLNGTIHRPRTLHGGGVMVAFRKDLVAVEFPLSAGKEVEIVCAKVSIVNSPQLYICAYYRPNKDTVAALDNLELALDELQAEMDKNPRAGLIVAGDFNAPGINWK